MRPPHHSQARLHRAGSVPCKPKTLKMSAYGTFFPYCATPKGLANTVGAAHTRVRHVAGVQGKTSCTLTTNVGSPPTCKGQAASGCFASLDRSPAPSASVNVAMFTEVERGQGRRSRAFLPLTPWSRPNTPATGSGGWVLTACPCGATK